MLTRHNAGHSLALLGSILLLVTGAALLVTVFTASYLHAADGVSWNAILNTTPLPAVAGLLWLLTVGGGAASITAIAVYEYRARWFWRCMVAAAALWLFAPPVHFVIGLAALIVLLGSRRSFVDHHDKAAPAHS